MKHIHFIGICGVGMGALAVLWKQKGWKVTGSDVGFYPPISTHLKNHSIEYYPGWHPEKIGCHREPAGRGDLLANQRLRSLSRNEVRDPAPRNDSNRPDLVVVGNVAGSKNPEWLAVQENKIPYVSYPELIAQNLVKKNSIVCAGTYGKTSSAVLLSWILIEAGYNPAYMFGGLSLNLENSASDPENSEWSILEGDEYKTARWDDQAKFFSYKPTHLLLTDIRWDHADLYPTEKSYFDAFQKLVEMVPEDGLIVASERISSVIPTEAEGSLKNGERDFSIALRSAQNDSKKGNDKVRIVRYGQHSGEYIYRNVQQMKEQLNFEIVHQEKIHSLQIPIIGEYMAENICGCFALAHTIGIAPEKIISALNKFQGIKRRLEKRGQINGADIFDDIAHSPLKAKSVLETLRKIYTGKIYAIFEPNTGNRQTVALPQYDQAFVAADTVIIPRLTKVKNKPEEKNMEGDELTSIISRSHQNVKYIADDSELIGYLKQKIQPNDVVVFLGSHGFRGMIENLLT